MKQSMSLRDVVRTPSSSTAGWIPLRARLVLLVLCAAACACSNAPPASPWQADAHGALQGFTSAYLAGDTRVAESELARARRALSATGRVELVAQAELIGCAARTASLQFEPCTGFDALAADAGPAARAYAAYLSGRVEGIDASLLPAHHRAVLAAKADNAASDRLGGIEEPLARLVAAGVLLKRSEITPAEIARAVETASAQGWRRALLAWLGVQAQRAEQAGAQQDAARIRRRMALVGGDAN